MGWVTSTMEIYYFLVFIDFCFRNCLIYILPCVYICAPLTIFDQGSLFKTHSVGGMISFIIHTIMCTWLVGSDKSASSLHTTSKFTSSFSSIVVCVAVILVVFALGSVSVLFVSSWLFVLLPFASVHWAVVFSGDVSDCFSTFISISGLYLSFAQGVTQVLFAKTFFSKLADPLLWSIIRLLVHSETLRTSCITESGGVLCGNSGLCANFSSSQSLFSWIGSVFNCLWCSSMRLYRRPYDIVLHAVFQWVWRRSNI